LFVVGNFIRGIAGVLNFILTLYIFLIIMRAIVSWINLSPYHPLIELLHKLTEPVLGPLRRKIGLRLPIDISPIIVIIIIIFIQGFVVGSLNDLAVRLRNP
jgi:YggT family protein